MISVFQALEQAARSPGEMEKTSLAGTAVAGGALAAGAIPLVADSRFVLNRFGMAPRAAGAAAVALGASAVGSSFMNAREAGRSGLRPSYSASDVVSPIKEGLLISLFSSGASGLHPSDPRFKRLFAGTMALSSGASLLRRMGAKGVQQEAYERNHGKIATSAAATRPTSTSSSGTTSQTTFTTPQGFGRSRETGFGESRTRGLRAETGFLEMPGLRRPSRGGDPSPLTQMGGVQGAVRSAAAGRFGLRLQPPAPPTQTVLGPMAPPRVVVPPSPAGRLPRPQKATPVKPAQGVSGVNPPQPPEPPKSPKIASLLKGAAGNNMFNHGPTRSFFSGVKNLITTPFRMVPKPLLATGAVGATAYGLYGAGKPLRRSAAYDYYNTQRTKRVHDMYANWWNGAGGTRPYTSALGHQGPGPQRLTPGPPVAARPSDP